MKRLAFLLLVSMSFTFAAAEKAEARARNCYGYYEVQIIGREIKLGWVNLGKVRGIPKRKKKKCDRKVANFLYDTGRYEDFGFSRDEICRYPGGIKIKARRQIAGRGPSEFRTFKGLRLGASCR